MSKPDHARIIAELTALDGKDLPGRVDALVDAYLGFGAAQTPAIRNRLAEEFLAAAPFTELSYRIWRRILRDDTDMPEDPVRLPSDLLLPAVDFGRHAAAK